MSALYKCWARWLLYIHWKTIGHKIKSGKILKHERTKNYKGHLSNNWIIFRSRSSLLLGFIGVHGFGPRPGVLIDFTRKKPGQLARNNQETSLNNQYCQVFQILTKIVEMKSLLIWKPNIHQSDKLSITFKVQIVVKVSRNLYAICLK